MATEIMLPYDVLKTELKKRSPNKKSVRRTRRPSVLGPPPRETYAGPAFSASPSPGELPLPTFDSKIMAEDVARFYATMDLRRILRLD